jgi:hypothetical protein
MTRNYGSYENIELDHYRQRQYPMQQWDQRNAALELSYAERQQIRSGPIHRPERILSESEQEAQSGSSQTRRQRIAVAVSRIVGPRGWRFAFC